MKAIICLFIPQGRNIIPAYGDFKWNPTLKCHIWKGKEMAMEEFNQVADKVLHEFDFFGKRTVRIIDLPAPPPPAPTVIYQDREVIKYVEVPVPQTAANRPRGVKRRSSRPTNRIS